MRGGTPIDVPVPTGGWNRAIPKHRLPPNYLFDGQNMLVGLDGFLAPRRGYAYLQFQPDPAATTTPDKRIMQGIGFDDSAGEQQVVIATLTTWFHQEDDSSWAPLTRTDGPFASAADTPVRFAVFGLGTSPVTGSDNTALYGVNGWNQDPLTRWIVGDAQVQNAVDPTLDPLGPTAITADDLDIVADRLVLVNTDETGGTTPGHHAANVRWSAVLDGSHWPADAWNTLEGVGNLVAVRAITRTQAIVYGQTGAYVITAQASSDAGAFTFDRIEGVTVGPVNANALISIGGIHWYVGTDFHIWRCDGQTAQIMSVPIDAAIQPGATMPALAGLTTQLPAILYDGVQQRIWFFVVFAGKPDATGALVWNLRTQAWEVPQLFAGAITAAWPALEQNAPTWDFPGVHATTTLTAPLGAGDNTIPIASIINFPVTGTVSIPVYDAEAHTGELITYMAISGNTLVGCTRGMFGTVANGYPAGTTVTSEITWDDADQPPESWANWNAIPSTNEPVIDLGIMERIDPDTTNGFVARFNTSTTDNGTGIQYFANWGLISSPDTTQELQINTVDVVLQPVVGDNCLLLINVLHTPFPVGASPQILNHTLVGDDPETWLHRLDATIAIAAFKPGNYLNVQLSGMGLMSTHGGIRFGSMSLYADIRKRPDRLPGVPGLSGPGTQ